MWDELELWVERNLLFKGAAHLIIMFLGATLIKLQ